jgi:coproporphyrinogen III oxidase-like Fe-S oxidoreductase
LGKKYALFFIFTGYLNFKNTCIFKYYQRIKGNNNSTFLYLWKNSTKTSIEGKFAKRICSYCGFISVVSAINYDRKLHKSLSTTTKAVAKKELVEEITKNKDIYIINDI